MNTDAQVLYCQPGGCWSGAFSLLRRNGHPAVSSLRGLCAQELDTAAALFPGKPWLLFIGRAKPGLGTSIPGRERKRHRFHPHD